MFSLLKETVRAVVFVVVACLFLIPCIQNTVTHSSKLDNAKLPAQTPTTDSLCEPFHMIISTIDGKVSALDLHQHGKEAWSIEADKRPLVSSSLASLELVRNGKKMRLIPSLDGALYQFDGEKVEPVPMSADTLLSSTYQLSDDAMIVGSKSLQNFGINFKTGEVQFICNSDGCVTNQGEAKDPVNGSDVVVVTRITQVVRSVDMKHGQEKWNFSVGEHLLSLPSPESQSQIGDYHQKLGDELPNMFSGKKDKKCSNKDDFSDENFLRLIVPEGKVVALNKHDSSKVSWEYKLKSPIAKAWLLRKGKLHVMNLFTEQHIPTMSTFTPDDTETDSSTQPLLYIGSHKKLLYIQPSPGMEAMLKMYSGHRVGHVIDPKIKVAWRPYLNTASYRTPIFGGNRQTVVDKRKNDKISKNKKQQNSLAVWHEEYPFDTGYFLYPEFKDTGTAKKPMLINELLKKQMESRIVNFFWNYRREIIVLIIFTVFISLGVDFFIVKILFSRRPPILPCHSDSENSTKSTENSSGTTYVSTDSLSVLPKIVSHLDEYVSRFETDFDCVQCLGKGGYGVVMEAVNKVDDQHYAVKRIRLPRSEDAKEKVLREVKTLAKLEHVGIVRYFNAWVESPPPGWQEEKDFNLGLSDLSRQTITNITQSSVAKSRQKLVKKSRLSPFSKRIDSDSSITPNLNPNLDTNTNTDSIVFASENSVSDLPGNRLERQGSGEFTFRSELTGSNSSSNEVGMLPRNCNREMVMNSFSWGEEESGSCSRSSVPFSNYTLSSSRHSPTRDDEFSQDSVVFEESKSLSENVVKNSKPFQNSEIISIPSSENNTQENTEQVVEKNEKEQGAKFFLYIQMQLYQKETLKEWLHNNTLNRNRVELMNIFDQLLCAVDYVHTCGLMHRDLKPSNIFFTEEGVVKVGDFGLVTPFSIEEDKDLQTFSGDHISSGHTADVGTMLYMSPEQLARKPYNLKVDVFSLGLIFLELWMPFSTQMERIKTLQDARKHILPARFGRELPAECELVKRMTSEDPAYRPNIKEIMDHSLLKDFAPSRYDQRHRSRTISSNSSD